MTHVLTVTVKGEDNYETELECLNPDTCTGWTECDLERGDYYNPNLELDKTPEKAAKHRPWYDNYEHVFHGVKHTWKWECEAWTVPFQGCIADELWNETGRELPPGISVERSGKYLVDPDYPEPGYVDLYLVRELEPGEQVTP